METPVYKVFWILYGNLNSSLYNRVCHLLSVTLHDDCMGILLVSPDFCMKLFFGIIMSYEEDELLSIHVLLL
jgi:hypothetical protein